MINQIKSRRGTNGQRGHRVTAVVCALSLSVLLVGNVAARTLPDDNGGSVPLVTPKFNHAAVARQQFILKMATTAGRQVLEHG